jgi:5'-3' exonuclease
MPTIHLVDASPYIFRAYFSLPTSIRTPDGRPANAVRGFASTLVQLFEQESVSHVAVTFDESLTTSFRNEIYPGYKANRELPPAELKAQLDDCRSLAAALGTATFVDSRYEADDLIATLWARLRAEGHRVVVVSPDKDLCQLVDEGTELLDFAKNKRFGPREVQEKLGVPPEKVLDMQALAGDAVDAIPGVKGIGGKTAAALLGVFDSLEEIYERLEEVSGLGIRGAASVQRKLEAGREDAFLSRQLAALATDAPAEAGLEELAYDGADRPVLSGELERLGLEPLLNRARVRD